MRIRKSFYILCACLFTFMGVKGAPMVFNVESPRWTKLAASKSNEGVNIRKRPSTSSPRLVYNAAKITDYETPLVYYGYWSATTPKGTVQAIKFTGPGAVVSERDGWYEILNIGPEEKQNGWVSAQYCNLITPDAIEFGSTNEAKDFIWLNSANNTSAGIYGIYISLDELNNMVTFYLGRLVNGMVVMPYQLVCDNVIYDADKKISIHPNGYGGHELICNQSLTVGEYDPEIDLRKFPQEMIKYIMENSVKGTEKVVYLYDGRYCLSDY